MTAEGEWAKPIYGLKWNPFSSDVPVEDLWKSPKIDHFCWRMEHLSREGGFALITGDPGTGKSVALRTLAHHLAPLPDVVTGVLTRPQSTLGDFYRELGDLFGVPLSPRNRWGGFKLLRQAWLTLSYLSPQELLEWVEHVLAQAGGPQLMTSEVMKTLAEHAAGNLRVLATMGNELLATAARRELKRVDQKLYLEVFSSQPARARATR